MISVHRVLTVAALLLAASCDVSAQDRAQATLWDRAAALQTVDRSQALRLLKPLYAMARSGDEAGLVSALSQIRSDPGLQDPARDYVVYQFTIGLGDLDAGGVGPEVIGWLSGYQASTLVPHEDHPRHAIPLFNVRAAAQGVVNGWERHKGAGAAERILQDTPGRFIPAYLDSSVAGRRGFIDAIGNATPEQAAELCRAALEHLADSPGLTTVAARSAVKSGDIVLLRQSIAQGQGPGLARALAEAAAELGADETAGLLEFALDLQSESKAALVLAQLAPGQLNHPAVRDLIFQTLSDQRLGGSAALILGRSTDPGIQSRLSDIAAGGEGLQKQRAQLAISFKPAGRID